MCPGMVSGVPVRPLVMKLITISQNLSNFESLAFISAVIDRYDFGWATKEQGQTSSWPPTHAASLTHPIVSVTCAS